MRANKRHLLIKLTLEMSKTQVLQRRGTIYRFQVNQTELFIVFSLEQIGVLLIPELT